MADKPSAVRNFFGRAWDRVTPGVSNYNSTTGRFSHTGSGVAQVGARLLGIMTGNPLIGNLASRGIGAYVNRADNAQNAAQQGGAPINGGSVNPGYTGAVTMPTVGNLGLGAQSPGGDWRGYLQGAGSVNNFGNQSFMRPGSFTNWSPTSGWGQQLMAQQPTDGSLAGFGNNVGGFLSGGARSGGGGVRSPVASSGSRAGLTRSGGSAAGWVTAINQGEILGQFQGDPERYTRAS